MPCDILWGKITRIHLGDVPHCKSFRDLERASRTFPEWIAAKAEGRMRDVLLPLHLGTLFLFLATASPVHSQSKPDFPLPEFYGTYAVSGGKIIGLDANTGSPDKAPIKVGLRNNAVAVCRNGAVVTQEGPSLPVPVFTSDVQFLVFLEQSGQVSPMMVAKEMELMPVPFIRNVQFNGCPNGEQVRSGIENGWGETTQRLELRIKPVPGQQQMVLTVPSARLAPGVYTLSFDPIANGTMFKKTYIFAVQPISQAASSQCFDLSIPYNPSLFQNNGEMPSTLTPCGSSPAAPATSSSSTLAAPSTPSPAATANAPQTSPPASGQPPSWTDPETGLTWTKSDNDADLDFAGAVSYCKSLNHAGASDWRLPEINELQGIYDPSESVPWNRPDLVALHIAGIPGPAHIKGEISVSGAEISNTGKPPADLQTFDFGRGKIKPIKSSKPHKYMRALCVRSAPASGSSATPKTSPASVSPCDQASAAPYAILAKGHLYKIKVLGPAGPAEKLFFFDEKGAQVNDPTLAGQLALSVWTHDNVLASPDARQGSTRVSAILGTSKALQHYTTVQDLLARGAVEAIEAVVTDGASLEKAVPNLTLGTLKSQLLNSPQTFLTMVAQSGLSDSLAKYRQTESMLPPQDSSVLNQTDLVQIQELYLQARALELAYGALAAKLMPTKGAALSQAALKSAFSELTSGPLFSGAPTTAVTLKTMLQIQQAIKSLKVQVPALESYTQNLDLAVNLTQANKNTINKWAQTACQPCATAQISGQ